MHSKNAILLLILPAMVLATPFTACKYRNKSNRLEEYLHFLHPLSVHVYISGGNDPLPNQINVPGCDVNEQVCRFHRNTDITATVEFTPPRPSNEAFMSAEVLVNGFWFSFIRNHPICQNLIEGKCPLEAGHRYTYRDTGRIPALIPVGRKTTAKIRTVDSNRQTVVCVQIAMIIDS